MEWLLWLHEPLDQEPGDPEGPLGYWDFIETSLHSCPLKSIKEVSVKLMPTSILESGAVWDYTCLLQP